ncbi:malonyl-CoA decarboxylase [Geminicoccaceae bacterium 1502E]|nr:malonyl-CoA decarboxylase [Geminicoccaceae bacterium 1502E]
MRPTMFDQLLTSLADAGRDLLRGRLGNRRKSIDALCRSLLSTRGDASGAALARELVETYRSMAEQDRLAFLETLARDYGPVPDAIQAAVEAYRAAPGPETLSRLRSTTEPPRQELFRRMNMAPGGTRALLALRQELLGYLPDHPQLREVDADLHHLLASWFNPGFLTLTRIDWNSPAALLEKLLRYEKVHKMQALEDLKRRLAPDRRCFAFFHPALPDEPLIFVQVALVEGMASRVGPLIDAETPATPARSADTAIFYSISNCQDGLRGVTLGNFLIKLVVASLQDELPHLRTFATLSPVPGFAAWLEEELALDESDVITAQERPLLRRLLTPDWPGDEAFVEQVKPLLMRLCSHYLVREKRGSRPRDPVARFHLGNGARLERINWLGDASPKGLRESFGLLVNYGYDTGHIERNHETFVNTGEVVHASSVRRLLPPLHQEA